MSKSSLGLERADLSPTGSSSSERKRKRQPTLDNGTTKPPHKVRELLASPEIKEGAAFNNKTTPKKPTVIDLPSSSSSKAFKATIPASQMYNFGGAVAARPNVIDLTSSPSSSQSSRRRVSMVNNAQPGGIRRIVVKNFQSKPRTDPKVYTDGILDKLDSALSAIYSNEEMSLSIEEYYKGVESLCRMGVQEQVNERLTTRQEEVMRSRVLPKLEQATSGNDRALLSTILAAWQEWQEQALTVQTIYMFLDRSYLLRQGKPSLQESSVLIFRKNVFDNPQVQKATLKGTCSIIAGDRTGDTSGRQVTSDAISMFHELGVYTRVFEPELLKESQTFIAEYAERTAKEYGLLGYITSSLELMDKEMERVQVYALDASTRKDLLATLEHHLVHRQQDRLTQQGEVAELLTDNNVPALTNLFGLLNRLSLTAKLRPPFEVWIESTGTKLIFDEKQQDDMVTNLLTLKQQLDQIWLTAFQRDMEIGHGLRKSFEAFMNKSKKTAATHGTDNSKTGEMIAKYVDVLLRGGSKVIPAALTKTVSRDIAIAKPGADAVAAATAAEDDDHEPDEEKEVDEQLEQVLDLFRFLHGKAVFEAFYKKDLARRLLLNRSASSAAELSMLTRLKTECGAQFTTNLDQMFKDIELGKEEMDSYKTLLTERGEQSNIDLSVNVLAAAAWPTYPDINVNLPPVVKSEQEKFEKIYSLKHSGRKLAWKHALSHCVITARYPRGTKELVVSGFQAIVLLLFNGINPDEQISYERLKAETGLPEPELKRTLQSLACAKIRPLRKDPLSREINPTDTFTFESKFKHDRFRVKINSVQLKETKEENKETHERIAADRNYETQAAIVRIMKSKKTIHHNNLVAEVIEGTRKRGVLSLADIKKNIDRLIDKEYMEREDGNKYSYIA